MYLTFKDKHDSNVAQRDVWYKKEKCCFDFLYHNRLSLSSTLCGEEPFYYIKYNYFYISTIDLSILIINYIYAH